MQYRMNLSMVIVPQPQFWHSGWLVVVCFVGIMMSQVPGFKQGGATPVVLKHVIAWVKPAIKGVLNPVFQ